MDSPVLRLEHLEPGLHRYRQNVVGKAMIQQIGVALFIVGLVIAPCEPAGAQPAPKPSTDPRDQEIFGKPVTPKKPAKPAASRPAASSKAPSTQPSGDSGVKKSKDPRDDAIFGDPEPKTNTRADKPSTTIGDDNDAAANIEKRLLEKAGIGSDKLQVGGQLYMRFSLATTDGSRVEDHLLSMPNLLDVYLDARPNDRVRAFARGRLNYDPTVNEQSQFSQLGGAKKINVQLIEIWLKLDIARRIFVTIGQQRILWGTTRLWNPVDFVNQSQRPLLNPFDGRGGVPMVKLHLPIESLGWNFYLAGLLDDVTTLDKGGFVGRAEMVFSTIELGINGAYRKGLDPRVGLDLSAGIWDFELTAEAGLRFDERFKNHMALQVSAGLQYQFKVFDDDTAIIGGEYFYNQQGVSNVNPLELFDGTRQFFYAGKHYGALFATLPRPGRLDDWTFTLSGIGNLSDQTFVGRLDVSVTFLTHITVQLFAQLHFGQTGELRIGDSAFPEALRPTARAIYNPDDPTRKIPNQLLDLGLWLLVQL
jgi:hypothetical protein